MRYVPSELRFTQTAQQSPRVDPGVVPVTPLDIQGVMPHRANLSRRQSSRGTDIDDIKGVGLLLRGRVSAGGTRTGMAEPFIGIAALVAIIP